MIKFDNKTCVWFFLWRKVFTFSHFFCRSSKECSSPKSRMLTCAESKSQQVRVMSWKFALVSHERKGLQIFHGLQKFYIDETRLMDKLIDWLIEWLTVWLIHWFPFLISLFWLTHFFALNIVLWQAHRASRSPPRRMPPTGASRNISATSSSSGSWANWTCSMDKSYMCASRNCSTESPPHRSRKPQLFFFLQIGLFSKFINWEIVSCVAGIRRRT